MAKIRTETVTTRNVEGDSSELEQETPAAPEVDDDDSRALVELGGGASSGNRWQVKCIAPADKIGFCAEYTAEEISLPRIAEEYGAGKYQLRCIDPNGRFVTQKTVQLRGRLAGPTLVTGHAPSPLSDPTVQMFLAQQKESTNLLMGILAKAFERPAPMVADPLDMLVKLQALIPQPKQQSEMDLFLKGLEFGKDLNGGSGGETGIMDLIGQGIKHVGPLLAQNVQRENAPVPALPSRPARDTAPASETGNARRPVQALAPRPQLDPQEDNPMLKLLNWLQKQLQALIFQASRQSNPTLYAEVFVDNLPNFLPREELLARMKMPDALQQLAQINPNVSQFPDWFGAFQMAVIELIESEMATVTAPTANPNMHLNPSLSPEAKADSETNTGGLE